MKGIEPAETKWPFQLSLYQKEWLTYILRGLLGLEHIDKTRLPSHIKNGPVY